MNAFRKILFPVDFSKATLEMIPYVKELAQRFAANLTILHAFTPVRDYRLVLPFEVLFESDRSAVPYTPVLREFREDRQRQLDEFTCSRFSGMACTAKIEDGDPASVIEAVARSENADLIIMPTRGHGKFRRLLLGSVTAKVLHDLACPVLTSAHEPNPALAPTGGFRSIVCAVELNPDADAILGAACFLARTFGARLCLVHMESQPPDRSDEPAAADTLRQAFRRVLPAGDREIGLNATVRILDVSIPAGIRLAALEERADLVVVGRGRETGSLSRIWSQLYTIIRESPCPVLSV